MLIPNQLPRLPWKVDTCKKAKLIGAKAIFGGDGADELFGGYETYRQKISNSKENNSNYSKYIKSKIKFSNEKNLFKAKLSDNWKKCLETYYFIKNAEIRNRLSMMLNDSSAQLSSVGLRGCDLMFMNYSVGLDLYFYEKCN